MRTAVKIVAVVGALMALTACKPVAATRSGTGATQSAPNTNPNAGTGPGGEGTVTLTVTQPVAVSGHAGTAVTCTTGRVYTATAQSATIEGYQLFFTVRVVGYRGPGSYPALVTLRLDSATGAVTTVSAVPDIAAAITDGGGSFSIHATGDNGRTLDASLQWTCS